MELLLALSMLPLAYYDYKKRILPHDYMAITLLIAAAMCYNQYLALDVYNILITSVLVIALLYIGFSGKWGMGDTKLCLILLLAYTTQDFLMILIYACVIGLLLNLPYILQGIRRGSPFGTYLTIAVFLNIIIN